MPDGFHAAIRLAECRQTWRQLLDESKAQLAVGYDGPAWACAAACYDALGDLPALQEHLRNEEYREPLEKAPREIRSFLFYMIGRLHQSLGEYDLALAAYMRASGLGGTAEMRVLPLLQTGTINAFLGQHDEAVSNLTAALEITPSDDTIALAQAFDFLSSVHNRRGNSEEARRYLEEARAAASGPPMNEYRLAWVSFTEGEIAVREGSGDTGLSKMRTSLEAFRQARNAGAELHACVRLASVLIERNEWQEARALAERAHQLGRTFRHNVSRIRLLALKARIARQLDGLTEPVYKAAMRRAEYLEQRATMAWTLTRERGQIFSDQDVGAILGTFSPRLFEDTCQRILEQREYVVEPVGSNVGSFSHVALRHTRNALPRKWAVRCFQRQITQHEIPRQEAVEALDCSGFILMTTHSVDEAADREIDAMRSEGVLAKVWDGSDVSRFLARHDGIVADVGTNL